MARKVLEEVAPAAASAAAGGRVPLPYAKAIATFIAVFVTVTEPEEGVAGEPLMNPIK